MKNAVFDMLKSLGVTSEITKQLYNERTRDVENLKVWRDRISGVIYIEDYYVGDDSYVSGTYRETTRSSLNIGSADFDESRDAERRFGSHKDIISGKNIADFGCGAGRFLKLAKAGCQSVCGIELQQDYVDHLNAQGIPCFNNLNSVKDGSLDVILSFHVIEHLPNCLEVLKELKRKIKVGGSLIIEVPHAKDFLLSALEVEAFKQFTLWSQHLVLHTRESLQRLLESSGFDKIEIEGVQRYPLSNHLHWLSKGKPGGHKSPLSVIDEPALIQSYESMLARIDATDTLVATAKVK